MKPPVFEYDDPETIEEAVAILAEHGDDAKVLAGGQSLIPLLNFRLAVPGRLVDINRIEELDFVSAGDGEPLAIGAATRMAELERSELIADRWPLIGEALRHVGHFQIRNRGTAGGSLAHADPAAELPAAFLLLGATAVARSRGGERLVSLDEFFLGYLTTALRPDELLTEIRVPVQPAGSATALVEFARRPGDFALAGAVCRVSSAGRSMSDVKVVVFGVGPKPIRLERLEEELVGHVLDGDELRSAAARALSEVDAVADLHGSADYRRSLAAELAARAIERAVDGEAR
ncbi:MAG TPA: xanthine dehydrogenase family protein subunit M [Gaiellaceae bacterium]|nr:xanthine dehydrogenase family protein subunit M [Gaiellaceae bacterium]